MKKLPKEILIEKLFKFITNASEEFAGELINRKIIDKEDMDKIRIITLFPKHYGV